VRKTIRWKDKIMISAVKAFRLLDTGLPQANDLVAAQIKAGTVSKVYQGDLDAMKKVSAKYKAWLVANNLISTDAKLAAPKGKGGVGHGTHTAEIKAALGSVFDEIAALKKKVNDILTAKKVMVEYQPFYRGTAPKSPVAPVAAPATK
jgi:hypothetical protein